MASDQDFVEFVVDQIGRECDVTYRKMFGEYGLYSKGKIVAVICDNQLFVKPTEAGRSYIGNVVEAPPYPGAKPSFLIEEGIEDGPWLTRLIAITEAERPAPKRKSRSTSKPKAQAKATTSKSKAKPRAKAGSKSRTPSRSTRGSKASKRKRN